MELKLHLSNRITFSLQTVLSHLNPASLDAFKAALDCDLNIENPAFEKASRFLRSRRGRVREPRNLRFWHIRKPKTQPSIEVPIGYLEPLAQLLRDFGFTLKPCISLVENPHSFTSSIKLRSYQKEAVDNLLKRHRGVLVAPCGAGKTVMSLELIARRGQKTLVLVHTLDLLEQWKEAARDMLGLEAATIGQGRKDTDSSLVIATVQTLVRNRSLITRLSHEIGTVIVDECHHTPASTFARVIGLLKPTYLYGVSATPKREDGLTPVMHLYLGPRLHQVHTRDLQKSEHLLKPCLVPQPTSFFYPYDSEDPESWHKMMEALITDEERNSLILSTLNQNPEDSTLVLSTRIEHLRLLKEGYLELNPQVSTALVTGQTPRSERQQILQDTREGRIQVLFATQLADEGLDIRCLKRVFLVAPTRNSSRVEQRVGRVMRILDGKSRAWVHDFIDLPTKVLHSQYISRYHRVYRQILDTREPPP